MKNLSSPLQDMAEWEIYANLRRIGWFYGFWDSAQNCSILGICENIFEKSCNALWPICCSCRKSEGTAAPSSRTPFPGSRTPWGWCRVQGASASSDGLRDQPGLQHASLARSNAAGAGNGRAVPSPDVGHPDSSPWRSSGCTVRATWPAVLPLCREVLRGLPSIGFRQSFLLPLNLTFSSRHFGWSCPAVINRMKFVAPEVFR